MAQYIQSTENPDLWVIVQPAQRRVTIVSKTELEAELAQDQAQLEALPAPLTNAQLLAWAKANYPDSGYEESRRKLTNEINRLQTVLANLV